MVVYILANKSFERTEEVANYLASVVLKKPLKIEDRKQLEHAKYKEYFGTYQLQGGDSKLAKIFMIDDVLVIDFPEEPGTGTVLNPIATDKMELKVVNIKIQFTRNNEGHITGFTVDKNGIFEWKKIK